MATHDEYMDALFGLRGGSPVADCDCGRVHYDSSGEYMEEGELAGLENDREADLNKYVSHAGQPTYISCDFVGDRVFDCPCGWELRLRQYLDNHVQGIEAYYHLKYTEAKRSAELFKAAARAAQIQGEKQ